ncbi:MAG TPA: type II secretion system protein [Planctomicrobium sp.]|nr:type II secretion system protein [Planctomicrobium sp.]
MINQHNQNLPCSSRNAFTLVEVLVVIGIVALLVSLLIAAIMPSLENARISATKAIIAQIDKQLQTRMTAFTQLGELMKKDSSGPEFAKERNEMADNTPNLSAAADAALRRKLTYLACFPQREEDLTLSPRGQTLQRIIAAQREAIIATDSSYVSAPLSSAEILYLLITEGTAIGNETYSADNIPARHVADTDGNKFFEFVDGWGRPIHFFSAPTGLFPRNGDGNIDLSKGARFHFSVIPGDSGAAIAESGELYTDPFDRLGRLVGNSVVSNPSVFYHPNTYFAYLLLSAGADGETGLNAVNSGPQRLAMPLSTDSDSTEFGYMFDNITNRQSL